MILLDVNVLVYAHREDAPSHAAFRRWLEEALDDVQPVGVSELVLSGFLRIVTHPKVFSRPTPLDDALAFAHQIRDHRMVSVVRPGPSHWDIFTSLCRQGHAKGNLVPDAYHAALAIESGCEWVTTDAGFACYPGLRWRHPLRERTP